MNSKQLKRILRSKEVKTVFIQFHGIFMKSTKAEMIWACNEFPNKTDWEISRDSVTAAIYVY